MFLHVFSCSVIVKIKIVLCTDPKRMKWCCFPIEPSFADLMYLQNRGRREELVILNTQTQGDKQV